MRSYLAPLGLAVAQRLGSPWSALDLDDDDESLARGPGRSRHRRGLWAPGGDLRTPIHGREPGLASSTRRAIDRRHGLRTHLVPNAVTVPAARVPEHHSDVILFVANLDYGPNVEAAEILVDRVHPALEARLGRPIRILLVGPYRSDGPLSRFSSHRAVTLTGFVEDLGDLYEQAGVGGGSAHHGQRHAHQSARGLRPSGAGRHHAGRSGGPRRAPHGSTCSWPIPPRSLAVAAGDVLDSPALAQSLSAAARTFVIRHHGAPVVAEHVQEVPRRGRSVPEISDDELLSGQILDTRLGLALGDLAHAKVSADERAISSTVCVPSHIPRTTAAVGLRWCTRSVDS